MRNSLFSLILVCAVNGIALGQFPSNGLLRLYSFTGNAHDSGPDGYDGTVMGAQLTTDRFNTPDAAYSFNGNASSYISIPISGLDVPEYSYSLWALLYSYPFSGNRYWALDIGSLAGDQFVNYNNAYNGGDGGVLKTGWGSGGYNDSAPHGFIYTQTVPQLNQWYHLVVTRSGTASSYYVNGSLVGTVNVPNNLPYYGVGPIKAHIGIRYDLSSPFHGKIDDIGIYNRALSTEEVTTLFVNGHLGTETVSTQENNTLLYPNPCVGTFYLGNMPNTWLGSSVEIITPQGKLIQRENLNQTHQPVQLNQNLPNGIYVVRMVDKKGRVLANHRVILQ